MLYTTAKQKSKLKPKMKQKSKTKLKTKLRLKKKQAVKHPGVKVFLADRSLTQRHDKGPQEGLKFYARPEHSTTEPSHRKAIYLDYFIFFIFRLDEVPIFGWEMTHKHSFYEYIDICRIF